MDFKNIKPLYDQIIVKRIIQERKKKNIIISNKTNSISLGKIILVGSGRLLDNGKIIPLIVKPNDKILFNESYNVKEEIINDEELVFLSESDILAIVEN